MTKKAPNTRPSTGLTIRHQELAANDNGNDTYVREVRADTPPDTHKNCEAKDSLMPQLKEKELWLIDAPFGTIMHFVHVIVSLWHCVACGVRNIPSEVPIRYKQTRYTIGFRLEIAKALMVAPPSVVAKLWGVSKHVIYETIDIFDALVMEAWRNTPLPSIIEIDQVFIKSMAITNVVSWETGLADSVLLGKEGLKDPEFVERVRRSDVVIVVMDYGSEVVDLVRTIFPNSLIVIDPPHAIRAFRSRGLKWLRAKNIPARLAKAAGKRNNNAWKKSVETAFAAAKPSDELSEDARQARWLMLQIDEVADVYFAYHRFRELYLADRTPTQAKAYLDKWQAEMPQSARKVFRGQLVHLSQREIDVLAYFRWPRRDKNLPERLARGFSSSATESLNNQQKTEYRRARGCSFKALRRFTMWQHSPFGRIINAFKPPRV